MRHDAHLAEGAERLALFVGAAVLANTLMIVATLLIFHLPGTVASDNVTYCSISLLIATA